MIKKEEKETVIPVSQESQDTYVHYNKYFQWQFKLSWDICILQELIAK